MNALLDISSFYKFNLNIFRIHFLYQAFVGSSCFGLLGTTFSFNISPHHYSFYIQLTVTNDNSVCFIKTCTGNHNYSRSDPGKNAVFYKGFSAVVMTRSGLSQSTCILQKVNKKEKRQRRTNQDKSLRKWILFFNICHAFDFSLSQFFVILSVTMELVTFYSKCPRNIISHHAHPTK